jgi:hypothetical protein
MTEDQEERLVVAFEQIATALRGIHDTEEKQFGKQWPERKEVRQAVYSRIPNEEDRIREEQGAGDSSQPIEDWYSDLDAAGIGDREREFLNAQATARAQAAGEGRPDKGCAAAAEDQAGTVGDNAADWSAV